MFFNLKARVTTRVVEATFNVAERCILTLMVEIIKNFQNVEILIIVEEFQNNKNY